MEPFLEKGNEVEISQARADYRRKYKADWRRNRRKQVKEITTVWNDEEFKILQTEVKRHKGSNSRFIKQATIAYINKQYLPVHKAEINKVIQLIALVYNSIEEMKEEEKITHGESKRLKEQIDQLEHDIRVLLFSPKPIWQVISETLTEKPMIKSKLISFIESFA